MAQLFLSAHCFVCETAGHAVFLDLKQDAYTAVGPEHLAALRNAVYGWPVAVPSSLPNRHRNADTGVEPPLHRCDGGGDAHSLEMLLKQGILTADAHSGKEVAPLDLPAPSTSFWSGRAWPDVRPRDLRAFILAWAQTTARLRAQSIGQVLRGVRRRKELKTQRALPLDLQQAFRLSLVHFVLQPAFYAAQDACLRNALTLLDLLARNEIYPTLVFGVRLQPFAAHCWVQHGSVVFTEPIEGVVDFTPIMAI